MAIQAVCGVGSQVPLHRAAIRQRRHDTIDAFASRNGRVLGVVSPGRLALYRRMAGAGLGILVGSVPLHNGEVPVSLQWVEPVAVPPWPQAVGFAGY